MDIKKFSFFADDLKSIVRIPEGKVTPYNAQATLHFYEALWALYLPVSVAGRVSDIWRSYFSQPIFKKLGLSLGFLPRPLVVQDRNPHSYTADFEAELPLYLKSSALAKLVTSQTEFKAENVPQLMENLWIDFYERGYIEIEDVYLVQKWLQTLCDIGYEFPSLQKATKNQVNQIYSFTNIKLSTSYDIAKLAYQNEQDFTCSTDKFKVMFGNSDLHEGCRSYFASSIAHVNQNITLLGLKGEIKNYPQINQMKGVETYKKLSRTLSSYDSHSTELHSYYIKENYNFFKSDPTILGIDAFVCSFPASMCQLWMAFEKAKIVFMPAHRYNLGKAQNAVLYAYKGWSERSERSLILLSACNQNHPNAKSSDRIRTS